MGYFFVKFYIKNMSKFSELVEKLENKGVKRFSEIDNFRQQRWIPTSSPSMNENLSMLGIPKGMIEIAGKSRSGKTTLALNFLKNFLKKHKDGVAVIMSSEYRDNQFYAKRMGIDPSRVFVYQILYLEDMMLKMKSLLNTIYEVMEDPDVYIIWDSIGSTISRSELEANEENMLRLEKIAGDREKIAEFKMKHEKVGAFAKTAKMMAKYMLGEMYSKNITFVMVNHQYAKIGGHGRQSFGGEWVEYMPTIRFEVVLIGHEKIDDIQVGQHTEIKVVKSDFGPRAPTRIEILLGYGLVLSEQDIKIGLRAGLITKVSARVHEALGGKLTWNSKRQFYELYKNPVTKKFIEILTAKIEKHVNNKVMETRGIKAHEDTN